MRQQVSPSLLSCRDFFIKNLDLRETRRKEEEEEVVCDLHKGKGFMADIQTQKGARLETLYG